jgi:NADH-quinone oxidoreductase subunit M
LSVLCASPLLAAAVIAFTSRARERFIRRFTLVAMALTFGLSLLLLTGDYSTAAMQFAERHVLVGKYGIAYSVGVDGMSIWLVLLTTFIMPVATLFSWSHIDTKIKAYAISLLVLESAVIGAFISLDLLLFYMFWELTLVPVFLVIGLWGGERRTYAALKYFMFTLAGSSLMLVAIVYLAAQYHSETGHYTFELAHLKLLLLPVDTQLWMFAAFALAFAVKVPLFPFHSWLPDAYVQAPIGGAVVLSAVTAKLATYGFLRFAMPLFPSGSHRSSSTLVLLAVIGIIYGAYCARTQSNVKRLVAYSSISHLGFVMLGIYTLNSSGLRGSILQMVNHGISTGALFLLVGVIHDRRQTLNLNEFGGVAKVMPMYAAVFMIVTMSAIGLPATNGFIGEFMILGGAFGSDMLGVHGPLAALVSATALVLAPAYALRAVYKLFWGPLDKPANQALSDLTRRERLVFAPLLALIFFLGLYPNSVLKNMNASVDRFALEYTTKLRTSELNPNTRGLLRENLEPAPPEAPGKDRIRLAARDE